MKGVTKIVLLMVGITLLGTCAAVAFGQARGENIRCFVGNIVASDSAANTITITPSSIHRPIRHDSVFVVPPHPLLLVCTDFTEPEAPRGPRG